MAATSRRQPVKGRGGLNLRQLVGSGDEIALLTLPFLAVGLILNIAVPWLFAVGGPPTVLGVISIVLLVTGVTIWMWSVVLIMTRVPRGELITTGPFSLVKHPIYTSVALLVLPWVGFLCNSWLGAAIGLVMYAGVRRFAPEEEAGLCRAFGARWHEYCGTVKMPWM